MENSKVLVYDGSFNGYLTALSFAIKNNIDVIDFQNGNVPQNGLFIETQIVVTQVLSAKEIWGEIEKKGSTIIRNVYFAFLSENKGVELLLYTYIRNLFAHSLDLENRQSSTLEHRIGQLAKLVGSEKRQMEIFIDFKSNNDQIYITDIKPKYNILPLISRHFRFKHQNHQWIIFDSKRNYGLYFNTKTIEIINLETKNWYLNSNAMLNSFNQDNYRYAV